MTELEHQIHSLLQTGGGSGRGGSFWTMAATCGRRANNYLRNGNTMDTRPPSWAVIGTAYHLLQEHIMKGVPMNLDYVEAINDRDLQTAFLLHRAWREYYGIGYWGTTLSTEQVYPKTEEGTARVLEFFSGQTYQIKPDAVVDMTMEDVARVRDRVHLPGPGRYIIDFKTAADANDVAKYVTGLQTLAYPFIYNLDNPEAPVKGIIFDIVQKPVWNAKDKSRKRDHFNCVYVDAELTFVEPLKGLVAQGAANLERGMCSLLGCNCV
jgi:hypothetical protein